MIAPKAILSAFQARITADTAVKTTLEPDPLDYGYQTCLRLAVADWDLDTVMSPGQVTLKITATLEASGDDAGVFLDDAMAAHLALVLWLNPENGELPPLVVEGERLEIEGQVVPGPSVVRNEEEGRKPFSYQKVFDLGLRMNLSALRS